MIRKINHRTKYVKIFFSLDFYNNSGTKLSVLFIKFDANYYHYVNDMKS